MLSLLVVPNSTNLAVTDVPHAFPIDLDEVVAR